MSVFRTSLFLILCFSFFLENASAENRHFDDIGKFAERICDRIEIHGVISREEIRAKLEGEIPGLARVLGAKISSAGEITLNDIRYEGLTIESLPAQMQDSRECKKEMVILLVKEWEKFQGQVSNRDNGQHRGNSDHQRRQGVGSALFLVDVEKVVRDFSNCQYVDIQDVKFQSGGYGGYRISGGVYVVSGKYAIKGSKGYDGEIEIKIDESGGVVSIKWRDDVNGVYRSADQKCLVGRVATP